MFIKGSSGVAAHPILHTYEEGYLLPVLSGDELLFGHRHKGIVRLFRDLAEVSSDEFDATYGVLLQNFMEFVQVLPHKHGGILGSLLNYGLARASAVFQKYCQMKKGQASPLLKFALFSAALLKDLGRVMSNQRIVLCTENDEVIGDWNPFSGSMVGQSDFFKLYPISTAYLKIESEVTLLLARQLIPKDVFLWLSNDIVVFSDWVSALLGQEGTDAKQLTAFLAMIKREDIVAVLSTLDGVLGNGEAPTESLDAEEFYRWIKESLAEGKIKANATDSGLYVVPEGVLIDKKLFRQFADTLSVHGRTVDYSVVYVQFGNLMGIPRKGGADFLHAKYFSSAEAASSAFSTFSTTGAHTKARTLHEGMVVDSHALFINKEAPVVSSLQSARVMTAMHHQSPSVIAATLKLQAQLKTKQ